VILLRKFKIFMKRIRYHFYISYIQLRTPVLSKKMKLKSSRQLIKYFWFYDKQLKHRIKYKLLLKTKLLNPQLDLSKFDFEKVKRCHENKNKRKASFLIIGTQKGGTSALYSFMSQHPEVCVSHIKKELHYFDSIHYTSNHRNYTKCFDPANDHKVIGEATPYYMFHPLGIQRIYDYNRKMKLIILLRDPIDRLYSQWNMRRSKGDSEYFNADNIIDKYKNPKKENGWGKLIARGIYTPQLDHIFDYFEQDQVLIIKSENLKNYHEATMDKVSRFLGIADFPKIEKKSVHSYDYIKPISRKDHSKLIPFFEEDLHNLREKYNFNTSGWLEYNEKDQSNTV
jgi:Sulfotransferase domain